MKTRNYFFAMSLIAISAFSVNSAFAQLKVKGSNGKVIVGSDRVDDDPYDVLSASVFGRNGDHAAGAKLAFGDFGRYDHYGWNVFVGEYGNDDSDRLWLHGKNGIKLTFGRGDENQTLLSFKPDLSNLNMLSVRTHLSSQSYWHHIKRTAQQDVNPLKNSLEKIKNLETVSYSYKPFASARAVNVLENNTENNTRGAQGEKESDDTEFFKTWENNAQNETQIKHGFVPENMKEIFPNIITFDDNGDAFIDYTELIPVLVSAFQEQMRTMTAQSLKIKELETEILLARNERSGNSDSSYSKSRTLSDSSLNSADNAFLYQNTPNPFNTNTEIQYFLPEGSTDAYIYIFDMQGALLQTFPLSGDGFGSVTVEGSQLSAGMYLYSLVIAGNQIETKRMILTK